jgi:hypothetical protein
MTASGAPVDTTLQALRLDLVRALGAVRPYPVIEQIL